MAERRANLSLGVSLIGSAALHVAVLVPLMLAIMTPASTPTQVRSDITERDVERERPDRDEPRLGIDRGTPSTFTWVGYEEFEEHLAQLSDVEQAAFRMHETGLPEPVEPQPNDGPVDETPAQAAAQDAAKPTDAHQSSVEKPATAEPTLDDEPADAAESAPPPEPSDGFTGTLDEFFDGLHIDPSEAEPSLEPGATDEPVPAETPGEDAPPREQAAEPQEQMPAKQSEPPEQPDEPRDPANEDTATTEPAERPADEAAQPDQQAASSPPQGEQEEGEISDREADATSIVDVPPENWRLGKPLAASGVELKPQRPEFTLLQKMSASPGNPLVVIRFGSDGVPREARVLRSSGSPSVDTFLESSLYRWRATGEEIDQLADDATFDVRIRIIFNPRALRREQAQEEEPDDQSG